MKITLISPYPDLTSFGVRTLSACLKERGHTTQLIFLPDPFGDDIVAGADRYNEELLDDAIALCKDSDLIGVTLMTNFFDGAVQITRKIREQTKAPALWGGVHPTIRPEESMEHADMVCIGDGEEAIMELADRMQRGDDYTTTANLWVRKGADIVKNPLGKLDRNLDIYPAPDYSMDDHHVMFDGALLPLTHKVMEDALRRGTVSDYLGKTGYQTMTSRGCPYSCTYCINDTLNDMYGSKKLRWRSVEHVMRELEAVKLNMPYVDYIWISDDEFFARKTDELIEFSRLYKERIGLPFSCLVSPLTVTEAKVETLVDAGLVYVQMGVESASTRMQEIYKRKNMNNKRLMKAMTIINRFKDKMSPPSYDFLLDAPYERDADKIDSLRFISQIPKPYRLQPFTLILYPGTELHRQASESGALSNEQDEVYGKTYTMREPNYLNLLFTLAKGGKFPSPLLGFLVSEPVVTILNSKVLRPFFKYLFLGLQFAYRHFKGAILGR